MRFDWLASPTPEAMVRALETMFAIGAIDSDAKLTSPTGFQTAEIPLVRTNFMNSVLIWPIVFVLCLF